MTERQVHSFRFPNDGKFFASSRSKEFEKQVVNRSWYDLLIDDLGRERSRVALLANGKEKFRFPGEKKSPDKILRCKKKKSKEKYFM